MVRHAHTHTRIPFCCGESMFLSLVAESWKSSAGADLSPNFFSNALTYDGDGGDGGGDNDHNAGGGDEQWQRR